MLAARRGQLQRSGKVKIKRQSKKGRSDIEAPFFLYIVLTPCGIKPTELLADREIKK
jgi:hypothetical protein